MEQSLKDKIKAMLGNTPAPATSTPAVTQPEDNKANVNVQASATATPSNEMKELATGISSILDKMTQFESQLTAQKSELSKAQEQQSKLTQVVQMIADQPSGTAPQFNAPAVQGQANFSRSNEQRLFDMLNSFKKAPSIPIH